MSQSESATGALIEALTDTNTGKTAFKHGQVEFAYNRRTEVGDGTVNEGANGFGWTQIDLADFDSNGKSRFYDYSSTLNPRAYNMARVFEHEYLGHEKNKGRDGNVYSTGSAVDIVNKYRRERKIPERLHYGASLKRIYFGSTGDYSSSGAQRKAVRKMVKSPGTNGLFIQRKPPKRRYY